MNEYTNEQTNMMEIFAEHELLGISWKEKKKWYKTVKPVVQALQKINYKMIWT